MIAPLGVPALASGVDRRAEGDGVVGHAESGARAPDSSERARLEAAAKGFEGVFLRQLIAVLRRTAPSAGGADGEGAGSGYVQMMDDALAQALIDGGGIGLSEPLLHALGGDAQGGAGLVVHAESARMPDTKERPVSLPGASGALARAASALTAHSGERFGRDGALGPTDLASGFATPTEGGEARFNVLDARGYAGYLKCNLFALESARRGGFTVPLVARPRGWGFPSPDQVVTDAVDGAMRRDWARVATGEAASELDASLVRGDRAFLLAGSGRDGHAGHMGVVERIHAIDYADDGGIERVVYDGWEGREGGAAHVSGRVWNRFGNPGGGDLQRNGFERIEILELRRPASGSTPELPISSATPAHSLLDVDRAPTSSSPQPGRNDDRRPPP